METEGFPPAEARRGVAYVLCTASWKIHRLLYSRYGTVFALNVNSIHTRYRTKIRSTHLSQLPTDNECCIEELCILNLLRNFPEISGRSYQVIQECSVGPYRPTVVSRFDSSLWQIRSFQRQTDRWSPFSICSLFRTLRNRLKQYAGIRHRSRSCIKSDAYRKITTGTTITATSLRHITKSYLSIYLRFYDVPSILPARFYDLYGLLGRIGYSVRTFFSTILYSHLVNARESVIRQIENDVARCRTSLTTVVHKICTISVEMRT